MFWVWLYSLHFIEWWVSSNLLVLFLKPFLIRLQIFVKMRFKNYYIFSQKVKYYVNIQHISYKSRLKFYWYTNFYWCLVIKIGKTLIRVFVRIGFTFLCVVLYYHSLTIQVIPTLSLLIYRRRCNSEIWFKIITVKVFFRNPNMTYPFVP